MVWGEARAAGQCVDAGAPEIRGKCQALLSGRAANYARQLACQRQSPDKECRFRVDHDRRVDGSPGSPFPSGVAAQITDLPRAGRGRFLAERTPPRLHRGAKLPAPCLAGLMRAGPPAVGVEIEAGPRCTLSYTASWMAAERIFRRWGLLLIGVLPRRHPALPKPYKITTFSESEPGGREFSNLPHPNSTNS